jgi:uncharacterized protein Usg
MLLAHCFLWPIERFRLWRIENHATVLVGLEVGMVEKDAVSKDFSKQVLGYGLTTAEIVYRRPDRHWLLQTYVWQDYDMFPNFPALKDFLAFWETKLEGPLFAVTVAHSKLIKPAELRAVDGVFRLH